MGCGQSRTTALHGRADWMIAGGGDEGTFKDPTKMKNGQKVTHKEIMKVVKRVGSLNDKYYWSDNGREVMMTRSGTDARLFKAYMVDTGVPVVVREHHHLGNAVEEQRINDTYKLYKKLQHPNIVELLESFNENGHIYAVSARLNAVSAWDWIVSRVTWTEADCRTILINVVTALGHLHKKHVLHRNLRPESILVVQGMDRAANAMIVLGALISDMTYIHKLKRVLGYKTHEVNTSLAYTAPEVLRNEFYSYSADMWSIGVLLFVMIAGYHPFRGPSEVETAYNIEEGAYSFNPHLGWSETSAPCRDLIKALLEHDPMKRPTCSEVLKHPWVKRQTSEESRMKASALQAAQRHRRVSAGKEDVDLSINNVVGRERSGTGFGTDDGDVGSFDTTGTSGPVALPPTPPPVSTSTSPTTTRTSPTLHTPGCVGPSTSFPDFSFSVKTVERKSDTSRWRRQRHKIKMLGKMIAAGVRSHANPLPSSIAIAKTERLPSVTGMQTLPKELSGLAALEV